MGRHQLLSRSVEDLTGVFSIEKFIQLWSGSSPGEISIEWLALLVRVKRFLNLFVICRFEKWLIILATDLFIFYILSSKKKVINSVPGNH